MTGTYLTEPVKYVATCPSCGAPAGLINPAWLRWRREQAGLTQKQLAQRLGLSSPYLSDVERGNRRCSPQLRARYEALGVGARSDNTDANTSTAAGANV